jgi:hypothetical protein
MIEAQPQDFKVKFKKIPGLGSMISLFLKAWD